MHTKYKKGFLALYLNRKVGDDMPRISFSTNGDTPFQQLLGYNPSIMESWNTLGTNLEGDGCLSAPLKEQVRRVLAQQNGC